MKYHQLTTSPKKSPQRVGRGIAAGRGKTAGRGTKGQKSRTGASARPGFEGGQNPIMQRLPKLRGFRSHHAKAQNIFTEQLEQFGGKVVDADVLAKAGLIADAYASVKLLNRGALTKKVSVKLPGASATAVAAVEQAGGSFEKVPRLGRPAKKAKTAANG